MAQLVNGTASQGGGGGAGMWSINYSSWTETHVCPHCGMDSEFSSNYEDDTDTTIKLVRENDKYCKWCNLSYKDGKI